MSEYLLDESDVALVERSCVPIAIYQFINKRVVTMVLSDGFCELYGIPREEATKLMDTDMYRDVHPDDKARVAEVTYRFAAYDEPLNTVYRLKCGEDYLILHARGKHTVTPAGVRLAVVWYTDEGIYNPEAPSFQNPLNRSFNRSLHQETLNQTSYYDQMTGLPRMNYFFELAAEGRKAMAERGEQMALLFFDLSGMKYFNSKYGFAEGDRLIKAVARVLVDHYSNENCSRFAQDHFAVFTSTEHLEDTLRSVFADCKEANDGKNLPLRVGIYLDRGDDVEIGIACDRAKAACDLNGKKYFSDYTYFSSEMITSAAHRQHIVDNLDRAIEEGWIEVYYQPIVRAANGLVCEEEALARWNEPGLGMLVPCDFIPILEDAKLIYKLDLCVLEQCLRKMQDFAKAGLHVVPASINLSRYDFEVCDIVEEVRKRVDASGIPRDKVTIEVTESVVGHDLEFMKTQIERFQKLGFSVWMDDFGTGYSSLEVLQSIRFDLIKFDMMFMRNFDNGDKSKIILTELIKMAIGLGIETVAEGVERQDQVDFLCEVGCNKLQGYYYTPPLSETQVLKRYETGTQIGFENPDEAGYFTALGGVNLYDMSIVTREDRAAFRRYFDTIPLAILELHDGVLTVARCNKTYRDFMAKTFDTSVSKPGSKLRDLPDPSAARFIESVKQCAKDSNRALVEGVTTAGEALHAIIKRVAVNPVTGAVAVAVAVVINE